MILQILLNSDVSSSSSFSIILVTEEMISGKLQQNIFAFCCFGWTKLINRWSRVKGNKEAISLLTSGYGIDSESIKYSPVYVSSHKLNAFPLSNSQPIILLISESIFFSYTSPPLTSKSFYALFILLSKFLILLFSSSLNLRANLPNDAFIGSIFYLFLL